MCFLKVNVLVAWSRFAGLGRSLGRSFWLWPIGNVSGVSMVASVRRFGLSGGEDEGVIDLFYPWLVEGVAFRSVTSPRLSVMTICVAGGGAIIDALVR